jgi:hypothetical protein
VSTRCGRGTPKRRCCRRSRSSGSGSSPSVRSAGGSSRGRWTRTRRLTAATSGPGSHASLLRHLRRTRLWSTSSARSETGRVRHPRRSRSPGCSPSGRGSSDPGDDEAGASGREPRSGSGRAHVTGSRGDRPGGLGDPGGGRSIPRAPRADDRSLSRRRLARGDLVVGVWSCPRMTTLSNLVAGRPLTSWTVCRHMGAHPTSVGPTWPLTSRRRPSSHAERRRRAGCVPRSCAEP